MSAERRLAALVLPALVAVGCGQSGARDDVAAYLNRVDAIQRQATPAFQRVQRAYVRLASAHRASPATLAALTAGVGAINAARASIAAVPAPAAAAGLRDKLLHSYALDGELATETALLGRYQPAAQAALEPLTAVNRRLQTGLGARRSVRAQGAALLSYGQSLDRVIGRLQRLTPPPVLRAAHEAELRRLRTTRTLAGRLRRAIARHQTVTVALLLLRFRNIADSADAARQATHERAAYRHRLQLVTRAQGAVTTERARLDAALK